ncbi:MAG TPA: IPT/TIG domain-containing protein [Labilithrix sp.]|nr:IPT/TIG domain-containing protein [Labilithrix sp.]
MILARALRLLLVPTAVWLASACEAPPPDLGGFDTSRRSEDAGPAKKGTPDKQPEPTQTPAPKGDTPPPSTPLPDQAPTLASISPDAITVGNAPNGVELTLSGTRFAAGSQVNVAGTNIVANVLSPEQLKVQVPADKVKLVAALRITVLAKPGLESNALSFTVANPTSVTIATLTPSSIVLVAGGTDVPVSVTGTGFTTQSVIRFNGAALPTTFASATSLSATIPAIAFIAAGRFSVTVATGSDVVSLPSPFEVRNPAPVATQIAPASVAAGDGATVVTVTGSKLTRASEVFAQGTALATTYVSATQLRATVPSYLIASAGTVSLVVTTGAPGGGTSAAQTLTVKAASSTTTPAPACAYRCADYNYAPFTCYANWYCIGTGTNAGCLAQIPCVDTPPDEPARTCTYKCTDYNYDPGDCVGGYYCQFSDGCLVADDSCP